MASATLGSLVVDIGADLARLRGDVGKATGILSRFGQQATAIGRSIKTAFAGIGIAAIGNLGRQALSFADNLSETADALGLTVERFQELRFAAQQSGVSTEAFEVGMTRLAKAAGEAGITTEQAFAQVLEEFRRAAAGAEDVAVATNRFGKGARQFALAFGDGGKAAAEMAAQLRRLGGVLSAEVVQRVGAANDKLEAWIGLIKVGLVNAIDAALPALATLGRYFDTATSAIGRFYAASVLKLDQLSMSGLQEQIVFFERSGGQWREISGNILTGAEAQDKYNKALEEADRLYRRIQGTDLSKPPLPERPYESPSDTGAHRLKPIGGGGTARGQSAYDAGLEHTNQLIKEEEARLKELESAWEAVLSPMERLNREWARLDEQLAQGQMDWELYSRSVLKAAEDMEAATEDTIDKQAKDWEGLGATIESSITGALMASEISLRSFKDAALSVMDAVAREMVAKFIARPIAQNLAGAIGSMLGSMAAAAEGGPVPAGQPTLVGERGPELFVPRAVSALSGAVQRVVEHRPLSATAPTLLGETGPEIVVPRAAGMVIPHDVLTSADLRAALKGASGMPASRPRPASSGLSLAQAVPALPGLDLPAPSTPPGPVRRVLDAVRRTSLIDRIRQVAEGLAPPLLRWPAPDDREAPFGWASSSPRRTEAARSPLDLDLPTPARPRAPSERPARVLWLEGLRATLGALTRAVAAPGPAPEILWPEAEPERVVDRLRSVASTSSREERVIERVLSEVRAGSVLVAAPVSEDHRQPTSWREVLHERLREQLRSQTTRIESRAALPDETGEGQALPRTTDRWADLLALLRRGLGAGVRAAASGARLLGNEISLVGERGPELFVPERAGTVIPHHLIGRAAEVLPALARSPAEVASGPLSTMLAAFGGILRAAAGGGYLAAGQAALVGERGPEMFVARPLVASGPTMAPTTNVTVNIQALDARSVSELLAQQQGLITGLVADSYRKLGTRIGS